MARRCYVIEVGGKPMELFFSRKYANYSLSAAYRRSREPAKVVAYSPTVRRKKSRWTDG